MAGTGLLVRSFLNLQHDDPGFDSHGGLTFDALLSAVGRAARIDPALALRFE